MAANDSQLGSMTGYSGRLKPFMSYRTRYSTLSTLKERTNSSSSIASMTGSTQNLIDPVKLLTMQDDAKCRRISSEVMKRCLYRQDVPGRRRAYSRMYSSTRGSTDAGSSSSYARMFQSLPPTPAQSLVVTPAHSPTNVRSNFYSFLSRGATPRAMTPETEEDAEEDAEEMEASAGLASVLRPVPRYVCAFPTRLDESADESINEACQAGFASLDGFATVPRSANSFRNLNAKLCQNPMSS